MRLKPRLNVALISMQVVSLPLVIVCKPRTKFGRRIVRDLHTTVRA
jgi:hypothetical protein